MLNILTLRFESPVISSPYFYGWHTKLNTGLLKDPNHLFLGIPYSCKSPNKKNSWKNKNCLNISFDFISLIHMRRRRLGIDSVLATTSNNPPINRKRLRVVKQTPAPGAEDAEPVSLIPVGLHCLERGCL